MLRCPPPPAVCSHSTRWLLSGTLADSRGRRQPRVLAHTVLEGRSDEHQLSECPGHVSLKGIFWKVMALLMNAEFSFLQFMLQTNTGALHRMR